MIARNRLVHVALACIAMACGGAAPGAAQTAADLRDAAFLEVQTAIGNPAATALAGAATRAIAADPHLDALLSERDAILRRQRETRDRQATLVLATGTGTEAELARIETQLQADGARLIALDAELDSRFPAFRALRNPAPLGREAVQSLLGPDEALVFIVSDATTTITWAVSRDRADWSMVALGQSDIAEDVRRLRQSLRADTARAVETVGHTNITIEPFDRTTAFELYQAILQPLEPVFGRASHVMVVADGGLSSLPFSVLVTGPPDGADNSADALRTTEWLIRRHALSTLPSVASLATLRQGTPRPAARQAFIGFGDPQIGPEIGHVPGAGSGQNQNGASDSGGSLYSDLAQWADLAPLPGTRTELLALAGLLGTSPDDLFLGPAATEARVKSVDLAGADIIAFATHGLLADSLPGLDEPALVFTPPRHSSDLDDALLTASEASELRLNASLIILSACDTAASDGTPGAEGLSGLAQAFIYAGARALLASHWPVDDSAAARLTTGMVRAMQDGNPRAQSLRIATLALMDDGSNPTLAHPRLWAPFVVVGEGWDN